MTKTCTKCKIEKPLEEFGKDKSRKDGLYPQCKACIKEYQRKYHENNPEKKKDLYRQWAKNNPEKKRELDRQWAKDNPEKLREKIRRRRAMKKSVQENFTSAMEHIVRTRFGNECFNCQSTDSLEVDHHYPLSAGNALTLDNAVLLCRSCNASKHTKLPEEFYSAEQLNRVAEILKGILITNEKKLSREDIEWQQQQT